MYNLILNTLKFLMIFMFGLYTLRFCLRVIKNLEFENLYDALISMFSTSIFSIYFIAWLLNKFKVLNAGIFYSPLSILTLFLAHILFFMGITSIISFIFVLIYNLIPSRQEINNSFLRSIIINIYKIILVNKPYSRLLNPFYGIKFSTFNEMSNIYIVKANMVISYLISGVFLIITVYIATYKDFTDTNLAIALETISLYKQIFVVSLIPYLIKIISKSTH